MKAPFIVFGTGRCGTTSLYHMLKHCKNVAVLREQSPFRIDWYETSTVKLDRLVQWFRKESEKGLLSGSVARYWLPHIEYLRNRVPNLKLICLHRDKRGTVDSCMRWGKGVTERGPKDRLRPTRKKRLSHYNVWPLIDAHTVRQSYEFYWEMYEEWSRSIKDVHHIDMLDLNNQVKVEVVFEYLEIPKEDRKHLSDTRYNISKRSE